MFSGLKICSSGRENFFGFIIERCIGEVPRSVFWSFERVVLVMALTLDWLVFMMGIVGMRQMVIGWQRWSVESTLLLMFTVKINLL